jgi:hypothetical protein
MESMLAQYQIKKELESGVPMGFRGTHTTFLIRNAWLVVAAGFAKILATVHPSQMGGMVSKSLQLWLIRNRRTSGFPQLLSDSCHINPHGLGWAPTQPQGWNVDQVIAWKDNVVQRSTFQSVKELDEILSCCHKWLQLKVRRGTILKLRPHQDGTVEAGGTCRKTSMYREETFGNFRGVRSMKKVVPRTSACTIQLRQEATRKKERKVRTCLAKHDDGSLNVV